jgi:N-methylhydantoinase A
MRRVVVPIYPGVFSALGALLADARFDYIKSRITFSKNIDPDIVETDFAELEERAAADFEREGFADAPRIVRSLDFRYYGQNWELEVQIPAGRVTRQSIEESRRRFDAEHERQFGWSFPESDYELVNFRVTAVATRSTVALPELDSGPLPPPARVGEAYFHDAGGYVDTPIYNRDDLNADNEIHGPAIVVEDDATALVPPDWTARVEKFGNMIVELA